VNSTGSASVEATRVSNHADTTPTSSPHAAPSKATNTDSARTDALRPPRVRPSARSRADSRVRSSTDSDSVLAMPAKAITTAKAVSAHSRLRVPRSGAVIWSLMSAMLLSRASGCVASACSSDGRTWSACAPDASFTSRLPS
jgi:hypothetical protein